MARTRIAQNSAGDLMFTLVQLDEQIMPPSRKLSIFRSWQQQFLELLKRRPQADRRKHPDDRSNPPIIALVR